MLRCFSTKAKSSPLNLINGIYNPPSSMSKRTAERWSALVQQNSKGTEKEKKDVKELIAEKCYEMKESDHNQTLVEVVSKKFGLDPPTARLKILNGEVWIKNSMHSKYVDLKPKSRIACGDTVCAAVRKNSRPIQKAQNHPQIMIKDRVIYRDDRIIVVNKWDIPVHGGSKHNDLNMEEMLASLVGPGEALPKIVHRLDKNTTGCIIFARTQEAANELSEMFKSEERVVKRVISIHIVPCISSTNIKGADKRMGNNDNYIRIGSGRRKSIRAHENGPMERFIFRTEL
jgi:23S rRNA-/tRNA-specific pseudouridylate synthase